MILDNADNLEAVRDFLPIKGNGHILLTTRAPVIGIEAQGIELDSMRPDESVIFLLRRARLLDLDAPTDNVSDVDLSKAREIAKTMGDLPLALAQAGAYIERTRCGLSGYLERYQTRGAILLKERSGLALDHPEPVATTWSLSFERVEQANPGAADLLRFCAFLHPDAIPEEIIISGASALTQALQLLANDQLTLDDAIVELLRFSLIRRNLDAKTLTIHRLVQAVLKDSMDEYLLRQWAERTVRAVNYVFLETQSYRKVEYNQRYLPHAQICASLINQWKMIFPEAVHLLNETGYMFYERGQYTEAEQLLTQALKVGEENLGAEHIEVAKSLTNLAELYRAQGKYHQAIPLCEHARAIYEDTLGPDHPDVAQNLNILARLYQHTIQFRESEALYQQARAIHEKTLGAEHPDLAQDLNDIGTLYGTQGKYAQAEQLYQQARTMQEKALGPEHPDVARTLSNMAANYGDQGKYAQAEQLYKRVYTFYLRTLGPGNIKTMEAMKDCNNASQKARQRANITQKTKHRSKKHR